jgi:hypothetical protein
MRGRTVRWICSGSREIRFAIPAFERWFALRLTGHCAETKAEFACAGLIGLDNQNGQTFPVPEPVVFCRSGRVVAFAVRPGGNSSWAADSAQHPEETPHVPALARTDDRTRTGG